MQWALRRIAYGDLGDVPSANALRLNLWIRTGRLERGRRVWEFFFSFCIVLMLTLVVVHDTDPVLLHLSLATSSTVGALRSLHRPSLSFPFRLGPCIPSVNTLRMNR